MSAFIDHWGGAHPLAARVRSVEPSGFTKVSALGVDEQRVRVLLDLTAPPADWRTLGDNFRVEVHIVAWQATRSCARPAPRSSVAATPGARSSSTAGAPVRTLTLGELSPESAEVRAAPAPATA